MTKGKLLFRTNHCHAVITSISWYKGASQAASVWNSLFNHPLYSLPSLPFCFQYEHLSKDRKK